MPLVPCCTNQSNENVYMPALPLPLIAYESIWPQHPDKPALPRKLNMFIRLKAKQLMKKYDDMYSKLQIL